MLQKNAVTSVPIHDLLTRRWSPRAFDASRPVGKAQRAALLEAIRWAPSANNSQPWRFIVCDKSENPAAWHKAFDCLGAGNQAWCKHVPLLMLSCTATVNPDGRPARYGQHDTGMAGLSLMLEALAQGLVAHAMAGYDLDKARAAFRIPADYNPVAMFAVGYQADPEILDEATKPKELVVRTRRPVADTFFAGDWGKGLGG